MPEDMCQTSEDVRMFQQIQAIAFAMDIKWILFFLIRMFYKINLSHDPLLKKPFFLKKSNTFI